MRKWLTLLAILLLLTVQASAALLPEELQKAVPEAAELLDEESSSFGLLDGVQVLLESAIGEVRTFFLGGFRSISVLMAGVLLLGLVEGVVTSESSRQCTHLAGALWVTAVSAGDIDGLMGLGRSVIHQIADFSTLLLPTVAAATAAGGAITSAAVGQAGALFFSNLLLRVLDGILIPAVYLYIGIATAASVLEENMFQTMNQLLRKGIVWALGGILTLYIGYMSLSGAIAGNTDQRTVRMARTLVSSTIPVVGNILSQASETVLASAGILKGVLGAFGSLSVLSMCLVPLLELGMQYTLYQLVAMAAELVGSKRLGRLLSGLGTAFGLVFAMTACAALFVLIAIVSAIKVVSL